MKAIITAIAVMFSGCHPAYADLQMPNAAGGKIILTDSPCALAVPPAAVEVSQKYSTPIYRAIGIQNENTPQEARLEACWLSAMPTKEEFIELTQQHGAVKIIPLVNLFTEYGQFTYRMDEFTPMEPDK